MTNDVAAATKLEHPSAGVAEASAAIPRFMGTGYAVAFVAVSLAGFLQAANAPAVFAPASSLRLPALALAIAVYTLLGTLLLYVIERRGTRSQLNMLFSAMLAIGSAATFASHGYTAMMLLAVVSASVLYLGFRESALVSASAGLVAFAAFALRSTVWTALAQAEITFVSGIAFVIVFSRIALRERRARGEVERLARELSEANVLLSARADQVEQLATARERNRVAREIHDGIGHYLTVVHIQLEAAQAMLATDPERARAALAKSQQLTHEGLEEVRRSVSLLRCSARARPPLADALAALVDAARAGGLAVELRIEGAPRRVAEPTEFVLYRATQEALTNVRRHASASRVGVLLAFLESGAVRVRVDDDGVGTEVPEGGFGLLGLRERATLVGGKVSVRTAPSQGFTLELEVPG